MTAADKNKFPGEEKIITTTCSSHCGGTCVLRVHVKDGIITRIETDDADEPQFRACLKGRAYRHRVYAPDRLLYPLRRVGERGKGEFERISWDEALETIAKELIRVLDTYSAEAILFNTSAGDIVSLHTSLPIAKVLSLLGGFSTDWGIFSFEQGVFAELATFGSLHSHNSPDDLLNSRLIVLWACDPANTVHDTNTTWYMIRAREQGTKIVTVDPRYTDTAATIADQGVSIIPGTDCAMMIAMAYVIIKENLHDQKFLDTYTTGFDQFRDYVMGVEDSIPKTPAWAETITSVPAATIEALARDYATIKPAALITGIAAGRTAYGEQYHRAAITLAAMTGNIGIHGGNAAGRSLSGAYPFLARGGFMTDITNPVYREPLTFKNYLPSRRKEFSGIGSMIAAKVADAILKGKSGGYPADYKLLFIVNTNYLTQHNNINKTVESLKKLEFIAIVEQFMTPSAKWADIVLPSCTFMERNDITAGKGVPFFGYQNKAIEPIGESRSHFWIATELAAKLGLSEFKGITEDEILRGMVKKSIIPDYDDFKETGVYRVKLSEPYVAFKQEIEDPEKNPFPTPSGKIEIYSQQLANMNDSGLPPIPKYIETWENRNDPLASKYPLQLLTLHFRRRAHSQNETNPWLREVQTHEIQINAADALVRGIADGDTVKVFNDRGVTMLPARVTKRIKKGVVTIPEGAWYDPNENGLDIGGCPNVLTKDEVSPGWGFITNTCLVQVEKT
ncbi:molybdopterin-dependent oxidoreductase [Candidatus Omnitrophota bacterium]